MFSMKAFLNTVVGLSVTFSSIALAERAYLPNQINYGRVVTHQVHKIEATYGRGAVLGAITGAVIAENDRGWGAFGGALVGAGLEAAMTSGQEAHKVVVQLMSGQSFSIASPPNRLRTGDCVAVEQTPEGTELMKVNYSFCEQSAQDHRATHPTKQTSTHAPAQQPTREQQCEEARSRLMHASDDKYNRVLADVQRYCQ
ncbi:hypothetical protein [Litoribacillus peritrichatus]|uniref:Glycine zipper 2TM domain-containing protein n=1 Tax=Litoribacillus peritrichatus TaxID=718191 RepID=A0ABP7NAG8_9GAMM